MVAPSLAHDFSKTNKNHPKMLLAMSQMRARALRMCITNTTPNPSPKNLTSTHPPLSRFQSKAMELIFWNTKFLNRFLLCLGTWGGMDMGWEQSQTGLNFFWPKSSNFDDFFKERFPWPCLMINFSLISTLFWTIYFHRFIWMPFYLL